MASLPFALCAPYALFTCASGMEYPSPKSMQEWMNSATWSLAILEVIGRLQHGGWHDQTVAVLTPEPEVLDAASDE